MENHMTPPYAFMACVGEIYFCLLVTILIEIQIQTSRELHAAPIKRLDLKEL
jgi:hypothetical protein